MNQRIKDRINQLKSGQVPEGYEKTSFGVFPVDWEKKKTLGNIFDFYGGLGIPRDKLGEKGIPYLHYGDMHRNTFSKVSYEQYDKMPKYDINIQDDKTYLMKDGDIVFLDASEDLEGTSRCVLIDNPDNLPFIAGLHTFVAREKKSVYAKYYKQYITSINSIKKQFYSLAVGFKVSGLNRNTIKKIKIAYPKSQTEQAKIAEILMKWDEAIEAQEQLINKLEIRKKALMQKLLTPKEGWEKIKLSSDIIEIHKSRRMSQDGLLEGKYPFYTNTSDNTTKFLDEYDLDGTYIIANTGGVAYFNYHCGKFAYMSDCYVFKMLNNSTEYVFRYLKSKENEIQKLGFTGSGLKHLDKKWFKKLRIHIPKTIEEQKRIANILSLADKEIELHKQQLEQLTKQRKSMMQLLLTGIVRTIDNGQWRIDN